MVSYSLQEKNGFLHVVLNYKDVNNKRHQKWVSTGLTSKGNKKNALILADKIKLDFEKKLALQESSNGILPINVDTLFIDYVYIWLSIIKNSIEASTYISYLQMINNRLKIYFSKNRIKLIDLQPIQIQTFYTNMLDEGLTANTVIHYHAIIRKSLDYAYKMNIISANPADKVQRPKKNNYIASFYSEDELNNLFTKAKGDSLELMILITSFYGLRRSEVLGLKWDSFDLNKKTITIKHTVVIGSVNGKRQLVMKDRTKTKSSFRSLPLMPEIENLLLNHKSKIEENKKILGDSYINEYLEYIFVNPYGKIFSPDYVSEHFRNLLKNNHLKHIRFHDLRHSCASLLLAKGIPMKSIQEWLGHSNFSTTANIYAHLDINSKKASADTLSNSLNI